MAIRATKPATPAAVAARPPGSADLFDDQTHNDHPNARPDEQHEEPRLAPDTMVSERYRIARVLGEGGMGVVYAAEHVLMRKEVAVKVLHAEMCTMDEVVARFEREAIAAAHIDHPNVAAATDFGRLPDGSCYLVLELLRGTSLREVIARGAIPIARALRILRGIVSGVAAAHAKGIVHRDLKPENVMLVDRDGDSDFVKVLDFGIAKVDPNALAAPQAGGKVLTRVGSVFGTPEYMAPEQAVGDAVDARADLYSLGVIYLEMITGICPFQGNPLSILRERILSVGPPDMSAVTDPGSRDLIARLLTREPDDRMQSATELLTAIDALLGDRGSTSPSPLSAPPPSMVPMPVATTNPVLAEPPKRRWIIPLALLVLCSISFGMFGVVTALSRPKAETPKSGLHHAPVIAPAVTASVAPTVAPAASLEASEPAAAASSAAPEPPPPPTSPTATASAASARAPKHKAAPKRPPPKKGGINIPPPKEWFK